MKKKHYNIKKNTYVFLAFHGVFLASDAIPLASFDLYHFCMDGQAVLPILPADGLEIQIFVHVDVTLKYENSK